MTDPKTSSLSDAVQFIKGVGPKRAGLLNRLNLHTAEDCLFFFPHRYEDRTEVKSIKELTPGETATFTGQIADAAVARLGRRRRLFEVVIEDGTGQISAKWFHFRESYMRDKFTVGTRVLVSGKLAKNPYAGMGLEIAHPDMERLEEEETVGQDAGEIVPVYPATQGLHQKALRQIMQQVADKYIPLVEEFIPDDILKRQKLLDRSTAFTETHNPSNKQSRVDLARFRSPGQTRLIFEELFLLQLGLALRRKHLGDEKKGLPLKTRGPLIKQFVGHLPFELTGAQKQVLTTIMDDLEGGHPMNRLLHGDVGSGKTVVALTALLTAVDNGLQGAFMAPTELLAEQHFFSLQPFCQHLGVRLDLSTSALSTAEKKQLQGRLASGETQIVVGTHALIQQDIQFHKLGLAVIDEQHRFGVLQRDALSKKGITPHILLMTATPIPRSLAMTLYGDMHVSRLSEMPPGRQPIKTLKFYENRREEAYRLIDREVQQGRQAYIVCPLIDESEKIDLHNTTEVHADLKQRYPGWKLALLHGRLKKEERQALMSRFKNGDVQVLVATTVIEVGIDVPNATLILIEHAERFGLAQLHQLRGRVGRGKHASSCLLVAHHPLTPEAKARLEAMVKSQDGFVIAEEDLKIRGPGDFMGTRQSGLPLLKVANLVRDSDFIEPARKEAFALIEQDPNLTQAEHQNLKAALKRYMGDRADLASIL